MNPVAVHFYSYCRDLAKLPLASFNHVITIIDEPLPRDRVVHADACVRILQFYAEVS